MPRPPSLPHPVVHLATDELHRGPWVYARQVGPPRGAAAPDGAIVEVRDASDRFLGHALHNGASDIRLRWLARGRRHDLDRPREFLLARLRAADRLRRAVLRLEETTDAYRVAHAEGDDLPGLVIDRLAGVLVCEHHSRGFHALRAEIAAALGELYPGLPVVHRVPPGARRTEGFDPPAEEDGAPPEVLITEHGLRFPVLPGREHKTGWFCDQRDNRRRIGALGRGRVVLDLCCNAGGFALQAARAGARRVTAVDLDEKVLARAAAAAAQNGLAVEFVHADAFDVLRDLRREPLARRPELVVLDPPKIAAGRRDLEAARAKYGDLNSLTLEALRPGGLLASFSCSGALDLAGFLGLVFGAARRAGREVKLLEVLGAGPDHPQRPDWPRSRYLKGALLAADA
ncbi:MAG: class I SAM-dependent rRNA methyltransferase [Planctomycetota bacterium]